MPPTARAVPARAVPARAARVHTRSGTLSRHGYFPSATPRFDSEAGQELAKCKFKLNFEVGKMREVIPEHCSRGQPRVRPYYW